MGRFCKKWRLSPHLFHLPDQHPSIERKGQGHTRRPSSRLSSIAFFLALSCSLCNSGLAVQPLLSLHLLHQPPSDLRPQASIRMIWAGGTSVSTHRKHIICEVLVCLVFLLGLWDTHFANPGQGYHHHPPAGWPYYHPTTARWRHREPWPTAQPQRGFQ